MHVLPVNYASSVFQALRVLIDVSHRVLDALITSLPRGRGANAAPAMIGASLAANLSLIQIYRVFILSVHIDNFVPKA